VLKGVKRLAGFKDTKKAAGWAKKHAVHRSGAMGFTAFNQLSESLAANTGGAAL